MAVWPCVCVPVCLCGRVDIWLHGGMAVWLCTCLEGCEHVAVYVPFDNALECGRQLEDELVGVCIKTYFIFCKTNETTSVLPGRRNLGVLADACSGDINRKYNHPAMATAPSSTHTLYEIQQCWSGKGRLGLARPNNEGQMWFGLKWVAGGG